MVFKNIISFYLLFLILFMQDKNNFDFYILLLDLILFSFTIVMVTIRQKY